MLVATNAVFGGFLLLAAGVHQLTPIKHACLRRCRSPLAFLGTHWRQGARGALRTGLLHGAFCVGCCWSLMGLMFFGGVMKLEARQVFDGGSVRRAAEKGSELANNADVASRVLGHLAHAHLVDHVTTPR